jgi:hypothetical protein
MHVGGSPISKPTDVGVEQDRDNARAEERSSGGNRVNGWHQILVGCAFHQIGTDAHLYSADNIRLLLVRAQKNDAWLLSEAAQASHGLEAIQFRHLDIEDESVRVMLDAKMYGLEAIGGLCHDRETGDLKQPA